MNYDRAAKVVLFLLGMMATLLAIDLAGVVDIMENKVTHVMSSVLIIIIIAICGFTAWLQKRNRGNDGVPKILYLLGPLFTLNIYDLVRTIW